MKYYVVWDLDVADTDLEAEGLPKNAYGAAQYALRIQRDRKSVATVFNVNGESIDAAEPDTKVRKPQHGANT